MPAIYLCNVTGTGAIRDPWKPQITVIAGGTVQVLAVDKIETKGKTTSKAIAWSDDNAATGSGVIQAGVGADSAALLANLKGTNLTTPTRNAINNYLTAGNLQPMTGAQVTRFDAVVYIVGQIEPATNVEAFILSH